MGRAVFGSHTGIDGSKYKVLEQLYIPIPMICWDFPDLKKLNTSLLNKLFISTYQAFNFYKRKFFMNKILVTGAAGFLGSHCLNALQNKNFEIYALDKVKQHIQDTRVKWVKTDLSEPEQVEQMLNKIQPDYLMHLAWNMNAGMQLNSADNIAWVENSMDLIRRFAETGGKRVVVSGSCAEYKWGNYLYDEETTPLEPQTVYGQSKHELQQKVSAFCNKNNLSWVWSRIFFMYGPNENKKRLVPYIIRTILKGEKAKTTSGNQIFDYLYVEDVARALASLIETDFSGAVNICSGQPLKVKDLIYKIANQMNAGNLIEIGADKTNGTEPEFVVGKNDRLKEVTGWLPEIDIDSGLKRTIQSIKGIL
jgi:nucleoside-diphosphate-sugar epimerase